MEELTTKMVQTAEYIKSEVDAIDKNQYSEDFGAETLQELKEDVESIITKMNTFIANHDMTNN